MRIVGFQGSFIKSIPENTDMSSFWMEVSSNQLHKSRFSSSTRTDKGCFFSFLDRKRKVRKHFFLMITIGDMFDLDIFIF